jgi:hypothetical protein
MLSQAKFPFQSISKGFKDIQSNSKDFLEKRFVFYFRAGCAIKAMPSCASLFKAIQA